MENIVLKSSGMVLPKSLDNFRVHLGSNLEGSRAKPRTYAWRENKVIFDVPMTEIVENYTWALYYMASYKTILYNTEIQ